VCWAGRRHSRDDSHDATAAADRPGWGFRGRRTCGASSLRRHRTRAGPPPGPRTAAPSTGLSWGADPWAGAPRRAVTPLLNAWFLLAWLRAISAIHIDVEAWRDAELVFLTPARFIFNRGSTRWDLHGNRSCHRSICWHRPQRPAPTPHCQLERAPECSPAAAAERSTDGSPAFLQMAAMSGCPAVDADEKE